MLEQNALRPMQEDQAGDRTRRIRKESEKRCRRSCSNIYLNMSVFIFGNLNYIIHIDNFFLQNN